MKRQNLPHPRWTKAALLLISTLPVMSGASLSSGLPAIQAHFAEVPNVGFWVRLLLTLPALFIMAVAPIGGALMDRYGRKKLLIAGIILFASAGTSGLYLPSIPGLLIGRAILGVAIAVIYTATTALIADYYRGSDRRGFLGLQAGVMAISGTVFVFIGGVLADQGWQAAFIIYGAALFFLPLAVFCLPEPEFGGEETLSIRDRQRLFQVVPAFLLVILYGLAFLGQVIFYTIPVQLPFHLQNLGVQSATKIGLISGFGSLLMGTAGILYGRIKSHLSYPRILRLCFGLIALGFFILGISWEIWAVLIGLFISGLGLGLSGPIFVSWLVDRVPDVLRGRALGIRLTFNYLGQFLSPILMQPLIQLGGVETVYLGMAVIGALILGGSFIIGTSWFSKQAGK